MTVFISHAQADQSAAAALESLLERRGQFVERDDGEVALAPVEPHDIVVALLSHGFAADANKLRLTQRALDAWSAGRLILVRLDETPAPIGLRDLPAADASIAEARDLAWIDVATSVQKMSAAAAGTPSAAPKRKGGPLGVLVTLALLAPGLFATAASVSIWLANRIGPRPGGWAELMAGIDALGRYYRLPAGVTPVLFAAALVLMLAVLARLLFRVARGKPRARHAEAATQSGLYVSAAAEDRARAAAALEGARAAGAVIDDAAADVASAETVLVMCSPAAYQSDQVKRDLFLAERAGKRVTPVFLDPAPAPEDFAYFLAADAGIALHAAAPGAEGAVLARALGAAPSETPITQE